ncbi:MAG: phosphoglucosamine mutase [Gammaproteobacteria bacterium]|nr:MAG: phosphoglucosamine mutase [Gammaproteobacteria bacterium]
MSRKYFGTDGVRGRVGEAPITPELVMKLGWAAGKVLADNAESTGKVVIGKDTRVSGYLLESALEAGLSAAGVDVSLIGPMPTPGIAYLTRTARAQAGIVISASHNPYYDNGIKFFAPDGFKLPDETERNIEAMMDQPMHTQEAAKLGKAVRYPDAAGRYIEFCKSTFPNRLNLNGIKVALDCANGAAYHVAPPVFTELGADVIAMANEPDGFNINEECGSTAPQALINLVRQSGADVGIALDGDGDRLIMVDENGSLVDGDQILYVIAAAHRDGRPFEGGVVGTLMTNLGLEKAFQQAGIPFKRSDVGDRYVMAAMKQHGWRLGGESSGHIICLEQSTTGDGIVAALLVLKVMLESGKPLSALAAGMRVFPQKMINIKTDAKFDYSGSDAVSTAVRETEATLADKGRVLLRASGTEPLIRVMIEGEDEQLVNRLCESLADVVRSEAAMA